jgi:hypothetical protein
MITSGIIVKAQRKKSKIHSGHYYDCTILCPDRDRTLMADPMMANFKNWEELIDAIQMDMLKGKGIALDNLKILQKRGKVLDDKLDADVRPEILDIVKLQETA